VFVIESSAGAFRISTWTWSAAIGSALESLSVSLQSIECWSTLCLPFLYFKPPKCLISRCLLRFLDCLMTKLHRGQATGCSEDPFFSDIVAAATAAASAAAAIAESAIKEINLSFCKQVKSQDRTVMRAISHCSKNFKGRISHFLCSTLV